MAKRSSTRASTKAKAPPKAAPLIATHVWRLVSTLIRHTLELSYRMYVGIEIQFPRLAREMLMMLGLAASVFIFASLWTFHPRLGVEANFAGPVGFFLGAKLFDWFGWLAYGCSIACLALSMKILHTAVVSLRLGNVLSSSLAVAMLVSALAGLIELHFGLYPAHASPAGGELGRALVDRFIAQVSAGGANLILMVMLVFALLTLTRFSVLSLLEVIGVAVETAARASLGSSKTLAHWTRQLWYEQGARQAKPIAKRADADSAVAKRRQPTITLQTEADENESAQSEKSLAQTTGSTSMVSQLQAAAASTFTAAKAMTIVDPANFKESRGDADAAVESEPKSKIKRQKQAKWKGLFKKDMPSLDLLDPVTEHESRGFTEQELTQLSSVLTVKLNDFGIQAEVEAVLPGPVVTRFEIQPAPGIKVSRITNLAKDLARSMAVVSVRVVEVIPGKTTVGIEIPNEKRDTIRLIEVLKSQDYQASKSSLCLALGKDIAGRPIVADLGRMPHLLVAGTTGSGKSVGLNAMLLSLLFKATPAQVRLIMIDPKMLELSVYDDIPHLLTPVVTDMKEAANALRWCVAEMERRYRLMAAMGVRNLASFNRKVEEAIEAKAPIADPLFKPQNAEPGEEAPTLEPLPYIVVVIDEFADMIMIVGKKVEELIARIAQKARAAGIHLLLATQRPSVDVITGLIKANVPTRIAFQVSSKVDSRTILDQGGAEQLLGNGDMLYLPPGTGLPVRVHGAFVADEEVHRVCDDWRSRSDPDYLQEVLDGTHEAGQAPGMSQLFGDNDSEQDPLYDEALAFVTTSRKASISGVQRKLKIGYNRAARLVESMEAVGVVSELQSNGQREVLAPPPVEC